MGIGGRQRTSRPGLAQRLTIAKAIALLTVATPAMAQTIQPDNTLGNENSRVVRNVRIRGVESDRIEGGSRRGQNLFHSFTEFSIPEGRGAYFLNPDGVRNIFGRVTGGGPSGIFGTLGVVRLDGAIGNANLFLINPNGIRFGRTAHLDLGGSFMGTTANAIQFGNLGNFSVTDASPPSPVLTINPSAFLFSSVNRPADEGTITVNASQPAPWNPNSFGLQVADGQSLTLLGRGVTVDAAQLNAFGGRVNLAAINTGTVGLTENGSLLVPTAPRGDITITNGSVIDVSLSDRGDIALLGRNINVLGESTLSAGIFSRFGTASSQAGNILLNATDAIRISGSLIENEVKPNAIGNSGNVDITADSLEIRNSSRLSAGTYGRGNAGDVKINVRDRTTIDGSNVLSNVGTEAVGNGGNVQITTSLLSILDSAALSASLRGQGNAGNVILNARDRIRMENGAVFSNVESSGIGRGGTVQITTGSLEALNGTQLNTTTAGQGNAGNVIINARDRVTFSGSNADGLISAAFSGIEPSSISNRRGGNVEISAGSLLVRDGAQLDASISGRGNAGNVIVNVRDQVLVENANLFSNVTGNTVGNGGNVQITTGSLSVINGGQLVASTFGQGDAGNIIINARDRVSFEGTNGNVSSAAASSVEGNRRGQAGNIQIVTGTLMVRNGGQLSSSTSGYGNAGNIIINARDRVIFDGVGANGLGSAAFSEIEPGGEGRGGNITIDATSLSVSNGAQLLSRTLGRGNAGSIVINVRNLTLFNDGVAFSSVGQDAVGNGGNIRISTGALSIINGGELLANTGGQGNAGNVTINARDRVSLEGTDGTGVYSDILSRVDRGAEGRGGNILINADSLSITNQARLNASLLGQGNAGNIILNVRDRILLDRGNILSIVGENGIGNSGNLQITTGSLVLTNDSALSTQTNRRGNAGNVIIRARNRVSLDRQSSILSGAYPGSVGNSGTIQINASLLSLSSGAEILTNNYGQGSAGNVAIATRNGIVLNAGEIMSAVGQDALGNGGNIRLSANRLSLSNGSLLVASTVGRGNAGNVTINVRDQISLVDNSTIFSSVESGAVGNSGNVAISARSLNLANRSRISADTFGNGNAGNIKVQSEDTNLNNSSISTAVNSGAVGRGGDINLRTRSLNLTNRAEVTASTSGQGNAGDITVRSIETVSLDDRSQISSAINRNAIGQGGTINIQTEVLTLGDRSQINSSSIGQGDTGRITIQASESIGLSDRSQISSQVRQNAVSNSQGIILNTPQLVLRGDAVISAATTGNGSAGDINIRNADRVSLSNSTLSTAVGSSGGTPDPIDPANLSTSRSRSASNQGDITIESRSLNLSNGSRITTNTAGRDNAGNVTIREGDITLSNSILSTEVTQPSTQQGGTIQLEGRSLTLDNARISASSQTEGNPGDLNLGLTEDLNSRNSQIRTNASGDNTSGGSIVLSANQINLTDSPITTTATGNNASGGSIRLMADTIRLRGNSDIRTNVSSGAGDGGDITLAANAILAFDDSDILSSAPDQGGNITLDTSAFFGTGYPFGEQNGNPNRNDRVDVNATGTVRNGTVTTPNTDLVQNNLGELPQTTFDAATQLQANRCIVRDPQTRLLRLRNRFIVTGGGGLPARPSNANLQTFPTGTIQTLPEQINSSWQPGEAIVEPQGVYQLPDGRLIMSRECPLGS